jgi:hypothetical protein
MGDKDKRISVVVINLNRDLKKERKEMVTDLSELLRGLKPKCIGRNTISNARFAKTVMRPSNE